MMGKVWSLNAPGLEVAGVDGQWSNKPATGFPVMATISIG